MENEIITRLFWAAGIILVGFLSYNLVNRLILARAGQASKITSDFPTLLYFTTTDCVPCRTVQRPAINKMAQALGEKIKVVEINAKEAPELARKWGVLSVPTTFVLDPYGKPLFVNHGVTNADKLIRQIKTALS